MSILASEIAHFDPLVLTANRRLALHLQNRFNLEQIAQHKSAWLNPNILPAQNWLQNLWHEHCQQEALLLSDLQERQIWQNIIEEDERPLLSSKTSASLAQSAYETLLLWNRSLDDIADSHNEQVNQFYFWARKFETRCTQNQWRSYGQMIRELAEKFSEISVPEKIYLDGFDDLAPVLEGLLSPGPVAGRPRSSNLHFQPLPGLPKNPCKIALLDTDAEIWSMALWAQKKLRENPRINIGCIVPNLAQIRNRVEYIFIKVFCGENLLDAHYDSKTIFNLSAGESLMAYDIIRTAKSLLDLVEAECRVELLGNLLQSPYLCFSDLDVTLGASCHTALLNLRTETLPLAELYVPLSEYFEYYRGSTWLKRIRLFSEKIKNLNPRAPSEWSEFFSHSLEAIGWPGGRNLESQDYQLAKRFYAVLQEFSTLDLIYSKLDFKKARRILNELLENTIFQPQSSPANIQILGTLESAGFYFDAAWIMGLQDETWPQASKPNPFLPYDFQRKHNMPHASPARELQFAKNVLGRLLKSASEIIVSYPQREGDKILQPSELISSINLIHALNFDSTPKLPNFQKTESLEDLQAPALTPVENIRGGSWILKQQSLCPFRGFASVRLKAEMLPKAQLGLNPAEKGILLHRSLEYIWRDLKDQKTLLSKSTEALQMLIDSSLQSVLQAFENQQANPREKFLKTEKKRLKKLLLQWLEFEKTREPFSVVATENAFKARIGELNLRLQVDRIDQLENGQYLIIDYKTGSCRIEDWFGDRPKDPQLPLYASFTHFNEHEYSGISFAELKVGKRQLKGIREGDENSFFEHRTTDDWKNHSNSRLSGSSWKNQQENWRKSIEKLSEEFSCGHAVVNPQDSGCCEYCDLKPLCRISS